MAFVFLIRADIQDGAAINALLTSNTASQSDPYFAHIGIFPPNEFIIYVSLFKMKFFWGPHLVFTSSHFPIIQTFQFSEVTVVFFCMTT